jgi:hypothetical protein
MPKYWTKERVLSQMVTFWSNSCIIEFSLNHGEKAERAFQIAQLFEALILKEKIS